MKAGQRMEGKAATRARVLECAKGLFAELTYDEVTIRMVALRINRSTGAVFSVVEDKPDLWRRAMGTEPPTDSPLTRAAGPMRDLLREIFASPIGEDLQGRIDVLLRAADGEGPLPAAPAQAEAQEAA